MLSPRACLKKWDQAEREERERQEVQVAAAEEVQSEHQGILRQTVEGFTTDLIDEVFILLVQRETLPSEVIEALDDGLTVRVDTIAEGIPLIELPEKLGMAISNAIMVKFPNINREDIEDVCSDAVAQAVLDTIESGY